MCSLGTFASLTSSLLAILKPESPRVFTSLARNNARSLPSLVKMAAVALHLTINSYHLYAICLHFCFVFLLTHDTSHLIRQLPPPRRNKGTVTVILASLSTSSERWQFFRRTLLEYTATGFSCLSFWV